MTDLVKTVLISVAVSVIATIIVSLITEYIFTVTYNDVPFLHDFCNEWRFRPQKRHFRTEQLFSVRAGGASRII